MINVRQMLNSVNLELLTAQAHNVLGDFVFGASFEGGEVILHLRDNATGDEIATATNVILSHDSTQRTLAQQEAADRIAQLEQLRAENTTPLNLADYATAAVEIRRLAEKIAWLELELTARR